MLLGNLIIQPIIGLTVYWQNTVLSLGCSSNICGCSTEKVYWHMSAPKLESLYKKYRLTLHPMGVLVKLTLFPTWGSGRNGPPYQEIICLYVFFPRSHSLHRYWWALLYTILSKHHFCPFYISLFFLRFYLGNGLHISLIDVRTNY